MESWSARDAEELAGADADFHRRDLLEAIERGDYPSWTLSVQVMPYEEAKTYRINPFDLTKTWPHADYPLIQVGTLTLKENPENFFAQVDQAAFAPSNIVPGIGFSPDRMLLARVFAYADAQRARIGVNHDQLPVNQPLEQVRERANTYTFDGPMRYFHSGAQPTYAASSGGRPYADAEGRLEDGWEADGEMVVAAQTLREDDDDFSQAGTLVREVFTDAQRDRLVDTVSASLAQVERSEVLERALWYWRSIDPGVGERVADAVSRLRAQAGTLPGASGRRVPLREDDPA